MNKLVSCICLWQTKEMANDKITLYHFTSMEGRVGITKTKLIKGSTKEGGDAHFGDGVYFTDMSPEEFTQTEVSMNNFCYPNAKRKLAFCIIVTMFKNLAHLCNADKRRVFLHPGDVNLNDKRYEFRIVETKFKEPQQTYVDNGELLIERDSVDWHHLPIVNDVNDIVAGVSAHDLHMWLAQF